MGRIRVRKAVRADYPQIVTIQNLNKLDNLTFEEEKKRKLIFPNFNVNILEEVSEWAEIWVATIDMEPVGFSFVWATQPLPNQDIFKSVIGTFPQQKYDGKCLDELKVFVHAPIYICKEWQKGVYKKMFEKIKEVKKNDFDIGITLIHFDNYNSLDIHIKEMNMKLLRPFVYNEEGYNIISFKVNNV